MKLKIALIITILFTSLASLKESYAQQSPVATPATTAQPAPAKKQDKINIAVSELAAKGISSMDASVVSGFLREGLVNTKMFRVLERSNMEMILSEQQLQMTGCTSEECAVQLGALLNVQEIIIGDVSKLGNTYYVSVRMVNVEKGEIEMADTIDSSSLEGLRAACIELAKRIAGLPSTTAPAPVPVVVKEEEKPKAPEKPKRKHKLGLGFRPNVATLKYYWGTLSTEVGIVRADYNAEGINARMNFNLNPNTNPVFYLGLDFINFESSSNLQDSSGRLMGFLLGLEIFAGKHFSFSIEGGPYKTVIDSKFEGLIESYDQLDFTGTVGMNIYFF